MQVGDLMTADVKTVSAQDTFAEVARILRDNRISSVVVKEGEQIAGIVTERDIVNAVADSVDAVSAPVADRMTRDLATVDTKTDVADAASAMAERRIRHLPVVDKGKLVGIVSIRDLTTWAVQEMTGGHELPDMERSSAALSATLEAKRQGV
jgi:CBS domain-containing protein